MAKSIETTYYSDATARCQNCESIYTLGMTQETITLEICGNCHPFYTGKETLIDTAGRIEKFKQRLNKGTAKPAKIKKSKVRKTIQTLADLSSPDTDIEKTEAKSDSKFPKEKLEKAIPKKVDTVEKKPDALDTTEQATEAPEVVDNKDTATSE
jgi:large subunit ribosomal protein L31